MKRELYSHIVASYVVLGKSMAQSLALINIFLFFFAVMLLYYYSNIFRYYFRIGFLIGWVLVWSFFLLPVLAFRGRNVANMRVLRFTLLPLKYIYGTKIEVQGASNLNVKGPYVIISNLQSFVDFLGIFQILPERCTFLVRKEFLYLLTVGAVFWQCDFIFSDHKNKAEATERRSSVVDAMLQDNLRIWAFSEGGKTDDSNLEPLQREAFHLAVEAQVPIIPVVISSYKQVFNTEIKRLTTVQENITLRILPLVETKGLSAADVPGLAEHVWETMLPNFQELSGQTGKPAGVAKDDPTY